MLKGEDRECVSPILIIFHISDQYSQSYILHPEVFMYAPVCHNNNLPLPSAYSLLDLDLHCEESAKKMIILLSASDYLHL